jgi:tRNA threonylcarbamoyladenosine biosynthesis protein TsaB
MRVLSVDTSTPTGGLAALEEDRVLGSVFERSEENYSSRLFRYLDLLLRQTGLTVADFDVFAVTAGPGSFTGLRVGLTAAKAWSELYSKPIAAVSGLEAVAVQANLPSGLIAAAIDARRDQDEPRLKLIGEETLSNPGEFAAEVLRVADGQRVAFISPMTETLLPSISSAGLHPAHVQKASDDLAPWVGRLGLQQLKRGDVVDALSLDANYIRRSDAEVYWKQS